MPGTGPRGSGMDWGGWRVHSPGEVVWMGCPGALHGQAAPRHARFCTKQAEPWERGREPISGFLFSGKTGAE